MGNRPSPDQPFRAESQESKPSPARSSGAQPEVPPAGVRVGPGQRPAGELHAGVAQRLGRERQRPLADHPQPGPLGLLPVEQVERDVGAEPGRRDAEAGVAQGVGHASVVRRPEERREPGARVDDAGPAVREPEPLELRERREELGREQVVGAALLEAAVDPAAEAVDRVVPAPQDPVVAGQPVVVEQVRRRRRRPAGRPSRPTPSARRQRLASSARSRRPAPSSAAAGAAATGTRWCRAPPGRRGSRPAGCARAAPRRARPGRSPRCPRRPAPPRPGRPAAAPRPAARARPSRWSRAPRARRGTSASRPRRAPRPGPAGARRDRPPSARTAWATRSSTSCGAVATVSSPVSSQRQSMSWRRTVSPMPARFSAPSRSSSASSSGQRSWPLAKPWVRLAEANPPLRPLAWSPQ